MKALIMLVGLGLGFAIGLFPKLENPRPTWWRWTVIAFLTVSIAIALLPPIGGTFGDAVILHRAKNAPVTVPMKATVKHETTVYDEQSNQCVVQMTDFSNPPITATVIFKGKEPAELNGATVVVVDVQRGVSDQVFDGGKIRSVNPIATLPFIIGLEERSRNIYFHVPMSWIAVLAYMIAMIYSVQYLRKNNMDYDVKATSAAAIGTLFAVLATITGSIWAKFNWGSFWNWDPRETSIFILLLIYGAYFALRSAIDNDEKRARLAAVYAIFAAVTVPFLVFIMPRVMEGLHPGSQNDVNAGPIVSAQPEALNPLKQVIFALSLGSFTMLFFWMLSLRIRVAMLLKRKEEMYQH